MLRESHPSQFFTIFTQTHSMNSMISEGVEVSVETFYQPDYSNPVQSEFMFAYRITLENHNSFSVKLLRRRWLIFDSNGSNREVEGEGHGPGPDNCIYFMNRLFFLRQEIIDTLPELC